MRAFTFTARTGSQLGFDPARSGRSPNALRLAGMFWTASVFAVGSSGLDLGVRWLPGVESILDLPMILIKKDRARTLATTLREGLPLAIIDLAISLGRRLCAEGEVRFDASVELIERIDPEQGRARRYIHSLGGAKPTDRPESGAWDQVVATAEFKRAQRRDERFDLVAASWALFQAPVALDAAMRGRVRQPEALRWRGHQSTVMHAAKALQKRAGEVPQELQSDPLWPAVMSLAEHGEACDGLAFVEAAAHLDESDQPERAVAALAAASYLSQNALGQALTPIAEAAAFIAKNRGWPLLELLLADPT